MSSSLAEKLDVWGFEEGSLVFKDFSLGAILRLRSRDISCATDEELNSLHHLAGDFLNGLPENLSIQFVQGIHRGAKAILEKHKSQSTAEISELTKKLTEERVERLAQLDQSGQIPYQSLYLVVRKPFERKGARQKRSLKFWKKQNEEQDYSRDILEPELRHFSQTLMNVRHGLEVLGIESESLSQDETFNLLFEQWNPAYP